MCGGKVWTGCFLCQQEAQLKGAMCTPCAVRGGTACQSQGLEDASRRLDIGSMAYMRQCSMGGEREGVYRLASVLPVGFVVVPAYTIPGRLLGGRGEGGICIRASSSSGLLLWRMSIDVPECLTCQLALKYAQLPGPSTVGVGSGCMSYRQGKHWVLKEVVGSRSPLDVHSTPWVGPPPRRSHVTRW